MNHPDRQPMRIFLAGATGVLGIRIVPLLIAGGHAVAGMTRSQEKTGRLRALGADPVVCDVFDLAALTEAVTAISMAADSGGTTLSASTGGRLAFCPIEQVSSRLHWPSIIQRRPAASSGARSTGRLVSRGI